MHVIPNRKPYSRLPLVAVVVVSLAFTLLRGGPLHGTFAALALTVLGQVYLPGYLLARATGRLNTPHPISRFAWVLACGLGLAISLGAICRLLHIPVTTYVIGLHLIMLGLAILPRSPAPQENRHWRLTRDNAPLYVLIAVCCAVVVGVNYESRYRFWGFEDQPIFISLIDWLATHPDEPPLRSRQIGVERPGTGDTRFDVDGWTYNHGAWVWTSGVRAAQLIWYDISPLFVWVTPLIYFALAYQLTGREEAGAWTAGALALVGLMTADNVVYYPGYVAFGRLALFQISTLRQASLTFVLPLGLLVGLGYLQTFRRRDLALVGLIGLALAAMHPFQIMILAASLGATALLGWLADIANRREVGTLTGRLWLETRRRLPLALVLLALLALPLTQRANRDNLSVAEQQAEATATGSTSREFILLTDFPLVGDTYIRNPSAVFYHPAIALGTLTGLVFVIGWRRSLAAQYLFGATTLALTLLFTPGVTEVFDKLVSTVGLFTTNFMLPVPLALGLGLEAIQRRLTGNMEANRPARLWPMNTGFTLIAIVTMGILLFEPFPIPASTRDQIRAFNEMQTGRVIEPAHELLTATLRDLIPDDGQAVVMTPYDVSNVVIENVPGAFITGGREVRNRAAGGDRRFFTQSDPPAPWLDDDDLMYIREWGVTHIVLEADDTRLAQLLLQPERFPVEARPAGYVVFAVQPGIESDEIDSMYGEMNAVFATTPLPRWGRDGFALERPGGSEWQAMMQAWERRLADEPDNARALSGLGLSATLAGSPTVLNVWASLAEIRPDIALFALGSAYSLYETAPNTDSLWPLLELLDGEDEAGRVMAARTLLSETFFYLLSPEQVTMVLEVAHDAPEAWRQLAVLDQPDAVRERASLLMYGGYWQGALDELNAMPKQELAPADMTAMAACALALGDVDRALATLYPATEPDMWAARATVHPDRWANNTAEAVYHQITAERAGQQVLSLLTIAHSGRVYAMNPTVTHGADESRLTVTALFGSFYPHGVDNRLTTRLAQVIDPITGIVYGAAEFPDDSFSSGLIQVSAEVVVEADVPPLTAAQVFVQARHDNRVAALPATLPVVLNRPDSAEIPAEAETVGVRFGDWITLEAVDASRSGDTLNVTLYWQSDAPLMEDYQVFVHVVDEGGVNVTQRDTAPVDNRYPTSQWREGVVIEDRHVIALPQLAAGTYRVMVGLYRLSDLQRLVVSPADNAPDGRLVVWAFTE